MTGLADALTIEGEGALVMGHVHEGWDVFGIPHGGYLAALAGAAVLHGTDTPDLFSITVHYLRKAAVGPMRFDRTVVGGSRRFTTTQVTASQDGRPVLAIMASTGDRADLQGPRWGSLSDWDPAGSRLSPPAGAPEATFPSPAVAERLGLRMDLATVGFVTGDTSADASLRGVTADGPADQLTALLACDLTPPAVWNGMGREGWVPTVELTAHVRARPADGPLRIEASTRAVTDGFLEEDAVVHDATGQLVVQSRQLARWTAV